MGITYLWLESSADRRSRAPCSLTNKHVHTCMGDRRISLLQTRIGAQAWAQTEGGVHRAFAAYIMIRFQSNVGARFKP